MVITFVEMGFDAAGAVEGGGTEVAVAVLKAGAELEAGVAVAVEAGADVPRATPFVVGADTTAGIAIF